MSLPVVRLRGAAVTEAVGCEPAGSQHAGERGLSPLAVRGNGALRAYAAAGGVLLCAAHHRLRMLVGANGQPAALVYDEGDDLARSVAVSWRLNLGAAVGALLRGGLPLHCATVQMDGREIAIMGVTGAGKTTLLWHMLDQGARMVCDDLLLLDRGPDRHLCGLPSVGQPAKLSEEAIRERDLDWGAARRVLPGEDEWWIPPPAALQATEPRPISALFLLQPHDGPEPPAMCRWVRVARGEALRVLCDHTQGLWAVQALIDAPRLVAQYDDLLAQCPLYALRYDRRPEMVPELARVIRELAGVSQGSGVGRRGPTPRAPRDILRSESAKARAWFSPFSRHREKPVLSVAEGGAAGTRVSTANILKWAAGAPFDLPALRDVHDERALAILGVDGEQVADLIVRHKLSARFVRRCGPERPGWCSRNLFGAVLADAGRAERRRVKQLEAMREITRAIPDPAQRPIAIKGYVAYALTGDPAHVHFSEDVDVYAADPERFHETLTGLGYKATGKPALHELAKMRRGDVMLEVHGYFPVPRYPPGVAEADLAPEQHPGTWFQDFAPMVEARLPFEDVAADALCGTAPGTEELRVPSPAVSVLAMCAHEFGNVLRWEYRGLTVHLATIAYIHDLCLHPLFDPTRFRELVERYGAHDAVDFAGHMMQAIYGHNPAAVPHTPHPKPQTRFPVLLHPQGIWTAHPEGCWVAFHTAEDYMVPRNQADTILNVLGANVITAIAEDSPSPAPGRGGRGVRVVRFGCDRADRLVVQSASRQTIPVDVAVQWDETFLTFIVTILRPLASGDEHYKVNIGVLDAGFVRFWVTIGKRGAEFAENYPDRASLDVLENGYRVRLLFPWWHVRSEVHRKNDLAATVAVSRWTDATAPACDPLMVVPLRIRRG